jgi:hypothetical protein
MEEVPITFASRNEESPEACSLGLQMGERRVFVIISNIKQAASESQDARWVDIGRSDHSCLSFFVGVKC